MSHHEQGTDQMISRLSPPHSATVEELVDNCLREPIFFFIGSGISIAFPSCLPSAKEMVNLTANVMAPEDASPAEKQRIENALPELFYDALYNVIGQEGVTPWEILTFGSTRGANFTYPPGPNLGHLCVVYLAWKNSLPVITTNFDLCLEDAATYLGLRGIPCGPFDFDYVNICKALSRSSDSVAIWKVHGSADDLESVCTTIQTISSFKKALVQGLSSLFGAHRACLVGYSGRDLDVFPFIAATPFREKHFWLSRSFNEVHAIWHKPDQFIAVESDSQTFAESLIERITDLSGPGLKLRNSLDCFRRLRPARRKMLQKKNRNVLFALGKEFVYEKLSPHVSHSKESLRLLIFGLGLMNIQEFRLARPWLERFLEEVTIGSDPQNVVKGLLALASCHHNLSEFEKAENEAARALGVCRKFGLDELEPQCLAELDEALRMQLLPHLKYRDWIHLLRFRFLSLLVRFQLDGWRLRRIINKFQRDSDQRIQNALWNTYIEHRVRRLAIWGQLFGELLPQLFIRRWNRLYELSREKGYAAGMANALKYFDRMQNRASSGTKLTVFEESVMSASDVYSYTFHSIGRALVERDQGHKALTQGQVNEARDHFTHCLELSRRNGFTSLELKALVGLKKCGDRVNPMRVEYLLKVVEGAGYQRIKRSLLEFIGRA